MANSTLKSWRSWFWHERDDRLRALWRILLMFAAFILVARGSRFLLGMLTGSEALMADTTPGDVLRLVVLLLLLWLMAKYVDKRPFTDYGLKLKQKSFWVDLLFGLGLGALLITAVFLIQYGFGWIVIVNTFVRSVDVAFALAILLPLLNLIAATVFVELFFRGFLTVNLAESFNFLRVLYQPDPRLGSQNKVQALLNNVSHKSAVLAAWLLATLFFILFRASSGIVTNVLILNLLRASFLLTLPFLLTRSLGMPIGLTLGWNFFATSVFGLRVTELIITRTSILAVSLRGPEYLTGWPIGPEAGFLGMGAIILGGMIVMLWLRNRQKQPPPDYDPWVFEYQKRE